MSNNPKNKKNILLIAPKNGKQGAMYLFTDNILGSNLKKKYNFMILNTHKSQIVRNHIIFNFFNSLRINFILLHLLFFKKIDLVIISTSSLLGFYEKSLMLIISKMFGKKTILCIHGGGFFYFYNNSNLQYIIRKVLNASDSVIVLVKKWKKKLGKITYTDIFVLDQCLQKCNLKISKKAKGIKILFVGRLEKAKGVYDLIKAIKIINSNKVKRNIKFILVGKDAQGVSKNNKIPNVVYTEQISRDKVMKYYAMSDIFVLPSYFEASPFAVLEAMSFGLPLVVTNVGAMPEVIEDGVNGFVVSSGNYKKLADKILTLITNEQLRKKMSRANIAKFRNNYSLDKFSVRLQEIFDHVIGA